MSLCGLLEARLTNIFQPYVLDFDSIIDLPDLLIRVQKLNAGNAAKVIKTWLNGWVTSYRMHEGCLHNCLLGCCGESDSMSHYVHCPHLYALIRYLTGCPADPVSRLGLIHPSLEQLKVVCCTFTGYHCLKALVRSGKFGSNTIDDQSPSFFREA